MKSHAIKLLFGASVLLFASGCFAYGEVAGSVKAEELSSDEFSFSFKKEGLAINRGKIKAFSLAPPKHRLFGIPDVNVNLILVEQQPGHVIPWHLHPRGSESYATISGKIEVSMTLEGAGRPRRVVSVLPPLHATSIPTGLPHSVKCLSDKPCVYHIFFNTADGGFVML